MNRKQRKFLVLLILAVVIITYNQRRDQQSGLPTTLSSQTDLTSSSKPETFDPEEEFRRLEKKILLEEIKDPEEHQQTQESRDFFEKFEKNEKNEKNEKSSTKTASSMETEVAKKGLENSSGGTGESNKGTSETYYVVQEQDTLSKISRKFYGTPSKWNQILRANSLSSDKHIKEGMKLLIPMVPLIASEKPIAVTKGEKSTESETLKPVSSAKNNASSFREYTTQKGDTLYKIAKKLFSSGSRWQEIYEWNKSVIPDPNNLRTGIILVIK